MANRKERFMSARTKIFYYAAGVILALLLGWTLMIFFIFGCCTGSLEKVPFSGVHTFYDDDGVMNVIFKQAAPIGNGNFAEVWADLDHVKVEIDSSLPGTAISAHPTFSQRIGDIFIFYRAKSVIVWVQDQSGKGQWEEFLAGARAERGRLAVGEISYQKVLP